MLWLIMGRLDGDGIRSGDSSASVFHIFLDKATQAVGKMTPHHECLTTKIQGPRSIVCRSAVLPFHRVNRTNTMKIPTAGLPMGRGRMMMIQSNEAGACSTPTPRAWG
jgi:hypothetical protein